MKKLRLNLQFFAEGDPGAGGTTPPAPSVPATPPASAGTPVIDYEKLSGILQGKQSATEESVLKGYFKQQGLSKEEADQAMSTFKQQKAAQQPDVAGLQQQAAQAQATAQKAAVENKAILTAIELGIDAKTVPYLLKLADFGTATGTDGNIDTEALKTALNKVLEDVPALKPTAEQSSGFRQVGASGQQQTGSIETELDRIFGVGKNKKQ